MLTDAANAATTAGEDIAAGLTSLLSNLESMSGGFQGPAGSAFQSKSGQLGDELKGILSALNQMAEKVSTANRKYAHTEEGSQQEISNVASQLPGSGHVADILRRA